MPYRNRYLDKVIKEDLRAKMVFIGGPRQSGKTSLARHLSPKKNSAYLTWDFDQDRAQILRHELPESGLLILDEIHKYKRWRGLVKGYFDKFRDDLHIIVTGSARLDLYRKGGDSLQGRYHFHRLYPFSFKEAGLVGRRGVEDLMQLGPFPEPLLKGSQAFAKRWSREYRGRIIKQDLQDLERISEISLMERMLLRLPELVGAPLSINALREDLQVAHATAARWLMLFENVYGMFRLYPFGAPKIRAVKKEAKHYHFDWTLVVDRAARFENLIAFHLLKWCHFQQDTLGEDIELRYFRDTDKREVDFVVVKEGKPFLFIEAKLSASREISPHLRYLKHKFPDVESYQVHLEGSSNVKFEKGLASVSAESLLSRWI